MINVLDHRIASAQNLLSEVEEVFVAYRRQKRRLYSPRVLLSPSAVFRSLSNELDDPIKQLSSLRRSIKIALKSEAPGTEVRDLFAAVKRYSSDLSVAISSLQKWARRSYWMRSSVKEYPLEESKKDTSLYLDSYTQLKETRSATRHVFTIRGLLD